jgi:hypothetical protein
MINYYGAYLIIIIRKSTIFININAICFRNLILITIINNNSILIYKTKFYNYFFFPFSSTTISLYFIMNI